MTLSRWETAKTRQKMFSFHSLQTFILILVFLLTKTQAAFSGVFSHNVVLQRAPQRAKIFGIVPSRVADLSISLTNAESGKIRFVSNADVDKDGNWKVTLPSVNAGGNYSLKASWGDGRNSSSIMNVTFGDVWYCAGQSNMELPMHFTFNVNKTLERMARGEYSNIRGMKLRENKSDEPVYQLPAFTEAQKSNTGWYSLAESASTNGFERNSFFRDTSAACLYFALKLTDLMGDKAAPLGLVQTAVGGSQIEAWTSNETLAECSYISPTLAVRHNASLYNGLVCPFVNVTLAGYLWYQGENNAKDDMGNSQKHEGYGCELSSMIRSWRQAWGLGDLPFGLVTLASGTDEGHAGHMSHMRWSQTANYGVVPNRAMPNVFLAQGYDIGDPWKDANNPCANITLKDRPNDCPGLKKSWEGWEDWWGNDAPVLMGCIHPRVKQIVGHRLALAAWNLVYQGQGPHTGPTLAGCQVDKDTKILHINFADDLFKGDRLLFEDYPLERIPANTETGLTLAVCVGNRTLCECSGWDTEKDDQGNERSICTENMFLAGSTALQEAWLESFLKDELVGSTEKVPSTKLWRPVNAKVVDSTLQVDLNYHNISLPIYAVRYAWSLNGRPGRDTCCPFPEVNAGKEPCPLNFCPLKLEKTRLPANPFFARVNPNGSCECLFPQKCALRFNWEFLKSVEK